MSELPESLAAFKGCGYVLAPAGFGKTHLIAQSAAVGQERQLILTHTYAGVNVIRRKLRELDVPASRTSTATIAGFALRLCLSYPECAGFNEARPLGAAAWSRLYAAARQLLEYPFVRRIVRASFGGLYVDEYQDCTKEQHLFVMSLGRDLPCRVLGDPLQAIFDFDGQELVDWRTDVEPNLTKLGQLSTPHRWIKGGNRALGIWLADARERLMRGDGVDVSGQIAIGITYRPFSAAVPMVDQANACRAFFGQTDSVVAMHGGDGKDKNKCHSLARRLDGRYSSIEEIEGQAMFDILRKLERSKTAAKKLQVLVAFAAQCLTAINDNLSEGTRSGKHSTIRANTKNKELTGRANAYLADPSSDSMLEFLRSARNTQDCKVFRADLLNRVVGVLKKHRLNPSLTLAEAAEKFQSEFRHVGRPVGHRRIIGTTLLVKGLEFQHAIVLDAAALSKHELYVALTRGSRSLTVLSSASILKPV